MHHRRWMWPVGATAVLTLALPATARADGDERPSHRDTTTAHVDGVVGVPRVADEGEAPPAEKSGTCLLDSGGGSLLPLFRAYGHTMIGLLCTPEPPPPAAVACLAPTGDAELPCPAPVGAPASSSARQETYSVADWGTGVGASAPAASGPLPAPAPIVPLLGGDASTEPVPPAGQTGEFAVSGLDDRILAIALASVFLLAALAGLRSSRQEPEVD